MKKIYLLGLTLLGLSISSYSQTAFTPGHLVVYTVGNGTDTLSSAPFAVSLDEYTKTGGFVVSHPLPTAVSGSNKRLVASGSATSEGQITRSTDENYILATGYDTFPDPTRLSIATSTIANVNRVVAIVPLNGTVNTTTALTDAFSTNNIRGVASTNGTDIWVAGTGTTASSGVRYTTAGATTSTQISSTVTNIRVVNVFNGQLYSTSQSKTFFGICADGSGTPITTGQTVTLLNGFPAAAPESPYAFSIDPTGTIAYVADGGAIDQVAPVDSVGGIQKWTFNGTTWTMAYILTNGLTSGPRNLVVDWSGTNPVIYATSGETPSNNAPGNHIITVTDAGISSPFTTLATAGVNKVFRGIAFTPEFPVPVTLTSFKAESVSNTVQIQWTTSQEINSKEFVVEKSTDGIHFTILNEYAAAGSSNVIIKYGAVDANPASGINYYRLKTVNKDGTFSYSNIAKINFSGTTFSIYPNPAKNFVTIQHNLSVHASLMITDMQGRLVQSMNLNPGSTFNKVIISNLSNGQYLLRYTDNNNTITHILSKQ